MIKSIKIFFKNVISYSKNNKYSSVSKQFSFSCLDVKCNCYHINCKKPYTTTNTFKTATIEKVFTFAYNMSFGNKGQHRNHRSGGISFRSIGEIFINVFQGKLAECAVYNALYKCGTINDIDFDVYGLGRWDDADLIVNNKRISIKSTKYFGNLLLLEKKDWDNRGMYIPNIKAGNADYDYIVIVRIKPNCEDIIYRNHLFESPVLDYEKLHKYMLSVSWEYNIAGFITHDELVNVIKNNMIIPQGALLNGKTKIDADNYYVQLGDTHNIDELVKELSY